MILTILVDMEENLEEWQKFATKYEIQLDASFIYQDDTTSYNIRRIKKDNQVIVMHSFHQSRYYEKFGYSCAESGIPVVILNSPMTYSFLDSYSVDSVNLDSEEVYPIVYGSAWYGIKTNGKFLLSNNRPSGVLQPAYYQDLNRKLFAERVFYRNFIFLNWTFIDNTQAAKDVFVKILKGFKGIE